MDDVRKRAYKALLNFAAIYMFINIGYSGLESLQSTLNVESGLGTTSSGLLNGCAVISCLFIGPLVVKRLSLKSSLMIAWSAYTLYILANIYPTWATLAPAAILLGLTCSISGIVYGVYLTALARQLSTSSIRPSNQSRSRRDVTNTVVMATTTTATRSVTRLHESRDGQGDTVTSQGTLTPRTTRRRSRDENEDESEMAVEEDLMIGATVDDNKYTVNSTDGLLTRGRKRRISADSYKYVDDAYKENHPGDATTSSSTTSVSVTSPKPFVDAGIFARLVSVMILFMTGGGVIGNLTSSLVLGRRVTQPTTSYSFNNTNTTQNISSAIFSNNFLPYTNNSDWTSGAASDSKPGIPADYIDPASNNVPNELSLLPVVLNDIMFFSSSSPALAGTFRCGLDHCPSSMLQSVTPWETELGDFSTDVKTESFARPETTLVNILTGVYLACNAIAVLLTLILPPADYKTAEPGNVTTVEIEDPKNTAADDDYVSDDDNGKGADDNISWMLQNGNKMASRTEDVTSQKIINSLKDPYTEIAGKSSLELGYLQEKSKSFENVSGHCCGGSYSALPVANVTVGENINGTDGGIVAPEVSRRLSGLLQELSAQLTDPLRLMSDIRLLFIIVPQFWIGVIYSFAVGALNQSYVGCVLSIAYVGYAMASLRLALVLASGLSGRLVGSGTSNVERTGRQNQDGGRQNQDGGIQNENSCASVPRVHRRYQILFSMLIMVALLVTLFVVPGEPNVISLFVYYALIGVVIGIFKTSFYGLFPLLFSTRLESALAHNFLWDSLGCSAGFIINDHLCFHLKAVLVLALTVLAIISYVALEFIISRDDGRQREGGRRREKSSPSLSTVS